MADNGFGDLVKQQKITNELLVAQSEAAGKPNPKKFIMEEIFAIRQNQKYFNKEQKADKDSEKKKDKQDDASKSLLKSIDKGEANLWDQSSDTVELLRSLNGQFSKYSESSVEFLRRISNHLLGVIELSGPAGPGGDTSGDEEDEEEEKSRWKKLIEGIQTVGSWSMKHAKGMGRWLLDQGKEKAKMGWKWLKNMAGKLLIAGLIVAAMAFLNSPYFEKVRKWFVDTAAPLLADLYEKILVPLWDNGIQLVFDTFETLKKFFTEKGGIGDAIDQFKKGEYLKSLKTTFFALLNLFDGLGTNMYNFIAGMFGWEKKDSLWNSLVCVLQETWDDITTWFFNIPSTMKKFIKDMWKEATDTIAGAFSGVKTWICDIKEKIVGMWKESTDGVAGAFTGIKTWIKEKFDITKMKQWKALTADIKDIWDIPFRGINTVIGFVQDIFGLEGKMGEPFDLRCWIEEQIDGLISWVMGALDWIPGLAPDTPEEKKAKEAKAAAEAAEKIERQKRFAARQEQRKREIAAMKLQENLRSTGYNIKSAEEDIADQLKQMAEGDEYTLADKSPFDLLRGEKRSDVVARLQQELANLRKRQENLAKQAVAINSPTHITDARSSTSIGGDSTISPTDSVVQSLGSVK